MTRRILPLALVALASCAGASSTLVGRGLYSIDCRRSIGNCYEEAAQVCPGGFDVEDKSEHDSVFVNSSSFGTTATPVVQGNMLVRCRTTDGE